MKLIGDVAQKSWVYEQGLDTGKQLYVGFVDNGKPQVTFDNLRFGVSVLLDGKQIMAVALPEANHKYLSSDQDFLAWFDVSPIRLGVEYQLIAWCENAGQRWENSFTVMLPRHPQPYSSWMWHDGFECWVPPVAYPTDGANYVWDEEGKSWVVLP